MIITLRFRSEAAARPARCRRGDRRNGFNGGPPRRDGSMRGEQPLVTDWSRKIRNRAIRGNTRRTRESCFHQLSGTRYHLTTPADTPGVGFDSSQLHRLSSSARRSRPRRQGHGCSRPRACRRRDQRPSSGARTALHAGARLRGTSRHGGKGRSPATDTRSAAATDRSTPSSDAADDGCPLKSRKSHLIYA